MKARWIGWWMVLLVLWGRVEAATIIFDECPRGGFFCSDGPGLPTVTVSGFDVQEPTVQLLRNEGVVVGQNGAGQGNLGQFTTTAANLASVTLQAFLVDDAVRSDFSDQVLLSISITDHVASLSAGFNSDTEFFSESHPARVETGDFEELNASFFQTISPFALVPLPPELSIQVRSDVPEPSAWLILVTGIVGLLGYGWQQRKKAAETPTKAAGRVPSPWIKPASVTPDPQLTTRVPPSTAAGGTKAASAAIAPGSMGLNVSACA